MGHANYQHRANLAIRPLIPGWKNVFETDIILEVEWLAKSVKDHVYAFHQRILSFIDDEDCDDSQLWSTLYSAMKHEMNGMAPEIRNEHRQLNRDFAIGIEQALATAYADGTSLSLSLSPFSFLQYTTSILTAQATSTPTVPTTSTPKPSNTSARTPCRSSAASNSVWTSWSTPWSSRPAGTTVTA